eukprot:m.61164 g.61164  ORF g.61164 m.61164 type:complete len:133 (-) comp9544_c0_seq3:30-428(-)
MPTQAEKDELAMLQSTRSSLKALELLLRKLNEDLAVMAENYRKLAAANRRWHKIAMAAGTPDAPTEEQTSFLREELLALTQAHRDSAISIRTLLSKLEESRPGFVPQETVTAILGASVPCCLRSVMVVKSAV